jgi:hypothetical protein
MGCDHLKALDLARDGSWDESHELVQQYSDKLACLIHAYLHRAEGNTGNAGYWYGRAGDDSMDGGGRAKQEARAEEMPNNTLAEELNRLYEMAENL